MNFLNKLLRHSCSHRFAWPRTDTDGRHYQICLICGTAYEYDWRMMRRTDRVLVGVNMRNVLMPLPVGLVQDGCDSSLGSTTKEPLPR
jgi:hypothetical protein